MVAVASKQKSILSPNNIRIKLCTASRGAYIFFIPVFFFWSVVCQQNEYFQSINTKLMQLYWCSRRRWKVVNADTDTGGIVYEFHYDGHLVRRVEADFVQKKKKAMNFCFIIFCEEGFMATSYPLGVFNAWELFSNDDILKIHSLRGFRIASGVIRSTSNVAVRFDGIVQFDEAAINQLPAISYSWHNEIHMNCSFFLSVQSLCPSSFSTRK